MRSAYIFEWGTICSRLIEVDSHALVELLVVEPALRVKIIWIMTLLCPHASVELGLCKIAVILDILSVNLWLNFWLPTTFVPIMSFIDGYDPLRYALQATLGNRHLCVFS